MSSVQGSLSLRVVTDCCVRIRHLHSWGKFTVVHSAEYYLAEHRVCHVESSVPISVPEYLDMQVAN